MPSDFDFSPSGIAKEFVSAAIVWKTGNIISTTITDHTQFDEDHFVPDFTGKVVGGMIAKKLRPYTDKAVDMTAGKLTELKNKRKQKKTDKKKDD